MHVLFVHAAFPGQFGHIAAHLTNGQGFDCTFVSEEPPGTVGGIRKIQYRVKPDFKPSAFLSQDFEEELAHAEAVYEALKPLRDSVRPDLIVGHAGWGTTLFLRELYPDVPVIDYFEYFYRPHRSAIDFRPEWPVSERAALRHRVQNAMIMLHLEYCTAGYSPTHFQHSLFPQSYRPKIRVIHDGIDTNFWRRQALPGGGQKGTRFVTYVSRSLESMRGFDIFMRMAKLIYDAYPDAVFLVAGWDTVEYGSDLEHIEEKSFKEHVLKQDHYDLDRIRFLGPVAPASLLQLFNLSDLHVYLTVPFVLSWSLLQAMACGCTILGSDTAPVKEVIRDGQNGILRDFFDVEGLAAAAVQVLTDPAGYRDLGRAAEDTVRERYSLDAVMPPMLAFYEEMSGGAS